MAGLRCGPAVHVDGSLMEGGGQILRNAVSLSAILGKPVNIARIRAGRPSPGLKAQHATGIAAVAALCGGDADGCGVGSTEVTLWPGPVRGGAHVADCGTAGSVALVLQAALPVMLFGDCPSVLDVRGGTNVGMSPQIDYLADVFLPAARRFGVAARLEVLKRGFYPKGGGHVRVSVTPAALPLRAVELVTRGPVTRVAVWAYAAGGAPEVQARRMLKACVAALRAAKLDVEQVLDRRARAGAVAAVACNGAARRLPGASDGVGVIVRAETAGGCILAGSALLERRCSPEAAGAEAAAFLVENLAHGGCVDEHLADQLVLFMALAAGRSRVRAGPLSLHTQTSIHFSSLLTGAKFTVARTPEGESGVENTWFIECDGIGWAGGAARPEGSAGGAGGGGGGGEGGSSAGARAT